MSQTLTQRRAPPVRQDEAEARVLARRRVRIRLLLEDAKDLVRIEESGHFDLGSASGMRQYGEGVLGLSARETFETVALGKALRLFPELESWLLEGRTTSEAAAVLGLLGRLPGAIRPADRWLDLAEDRSAKALRRLVDARLREVRLEGKGLPAPQRAVTVHLCEQGSADLDRAQVLASPTQEEPVGPSEAVEIALRHYVHAKDPLERKPGKRRMAPTDDPHAPRSRTIPAEVRRTVLVRAGCTCRIPYCDNDRFVQNAHDVRHADGGSREKDNLDLLCFGHHRKQERGEIRNVGTADEPSFVDRAGRSLHKRCRGAWARPLPPPDPRGGPPA